MPLPSKLPDTLDPEDPAAVKREISSSEVFQDYPQLVMPYSAHLESLPDWQQPFFQPDQFSVYEDMPPFPAVPQQYQFPSVSLSQFGRDSATGGTKDVDAFAPQQQKHQQHQQQHQPLPVPLHQPKKRRQPRPMKIRFSQYLPQVATPLMYMDPNVRSAPQGQGQGQAEGDGKTPELGPGQSGFGRFSIYPKRESKDQKPSKVDPNNLSLDKENATPIRIPFPCPAPIPAATTLSLPLPVPPPASLPARPPNYIDDFSANFKKVSKTIVFHALSDARCREIINLSIEKDLSMSEVHQVLWLLKIRNLDLKLHILAYALGDPKIGLPEYPAHEKDKGLIVTERRDGNLNLTIKTYAGADEDGESDFEGSIVNNFRSIKQFQIYFRQPNEPTTYKSKNNLRKRQRQNEGESPVGEDDGSDNESGKGGAKIDSRCVKRPLNSFMLYRAMVVKAIILLSFIDSFSAYIFSELEMDYNNYNVGREHDFLMELLVSLQQDPEVRPLLAGCFKMRRFNHHLLIQIVSLMWTTEVKSVKDQFYEMAATEKSIHGKCYPAYRYRPNRRNNTSNPNLNAS